MSMNTLRWKKTLALAAFGGTLFQLVGFGTSGCWNAVVGDIITGVGNGAIEAGVGAVTAGLPEDVAGFVADPIANGLQTAWSNIIDFQFPVLIVRQELFVE